MKKTIDPGKFNLSPKTIIEQIGRDHLAIVISRKSRVIISDGKKILEKANRIRKLQPESKISLKITAPLCSKTKKFMESHDIEII